MTSVLFKNAKAVLPDASINQSSILVENGKITSINSLTDKAETEIDLKNSIIFAGFIDIHNHGAVGIDVNEANADDLREVGKFLASKGITAWLPTFVPDSDEQYQKVVKAIEEVIETQQNEAIAQIAGVHYEGVFANEQMCGALRPEYFKTYTGVEIYDLPRLKNGVHLTTLAPEVRYGVRLTRDLTQNNWIVSIGHTKADVDTLDRAFEHGAKHVTHFFNAMTGLHHRNLGVVGWALNKDISIDIIADGIHVAPEILKIAYKLKTADKISLISDSVAPTGLGDGEFELWGERISVKNGRTRNERGSIAGSVITMLDAVKNYLKLGVSEIDVSKMASANPAKVLGIEKTHGTIEVGKRADLVAIDEKGNVVMTMIGRKILQDGQD